MPIEDADKVHSKRGSDKATVSIFGKKIGFMKLMIGGGVSFALIFILIGVYFMMTPAPIPVINNTTPIIPSYNINYSVISTNYGYKILKLSYSGDKPITNFQNELLLSMYPPTKSHYVQRQIVKADPDVTQFDNDYNITYVYVGFDNTFHVSYSIPKYSDCVDFVDGNWNLNIDDNVTKYNLYKFNYTIKNSKTKTIENGISITDSLRNITDYSTIFVYPGIYKERIVLTKSIRLIGIDNPIIDAGGIGAALTLKSQNNVISGLTLTNSGNKTAYDGGIVILSESSGNIIVKNTIYQTIYGIWIYKSSSNTISNNTIRNNDQNGIMVLESSSNVITNNIIYNNLNDGIHLDSVSVFNTIKENTVSNNQNYGIIIDKYQTINNICEYNIAKNNKMSCSDSIDRNETTTYTVTTSTTVSPKYTQINEEWWEDCNGDPKCYQS